MKKKLHIILTIVLSALTVYGFANLWITAGTTQNWESTVERLGGERLQNAKAFVHQYHRSKAKEWKDRFHPELLPQLAIIEALPIMQYFFQYQPETLTSVGYQFHKNSTTSHHTYHFQCDFSQLPPAPLFSFFANDFLQTKGPYSLVLTFDEIEKDNKKQIVNFFVQPLSLQQKQLGDFRLNQKGALHIVFLIVSLLVPIFIIFSLIQFVRMPERCQKTLWFVFIALGFTGITLNWATGVMSYALVYVTLLGAGVEKLGIYDPWIISVSIPIGALIFWFKRKAWLAQHQKLEGQNNSTAHTH